MKLSEIAGHQPLVRRTELVSALERNERSPEISSLMKARDASILTACNLIADDERDLIRVILDRLDSDALYSPSVNVAAFIGAVNLMVALCAHSEDAT